jgi:hypothetical protein
VRTVGFNSHKGMAKVMAISLFVCFLSACTDAPVKEFFCESTDTDGGANFYKQQIVRLSDRQMCVIWPSNAPTCVQANQPMTTPWQVNQETQIKHQEALELRISRESAVLQIMQRQVSLTAEAADERPASPLLRFEFKKRPEVLTVLTSAVDKDPRVFTCKPWTKRQWWAIY